MQTASLQRFAYLSITAALLTAGLKATAYLFTNSVAILSDALESLVNLAAALLALWVLKIAERPPDDDHEFGHNKAEYFSSGVEGGLIIVAALAIVYSAVQRLLEPVGVTSLDLGLVITLIAGLVNLGVGWLLVRTGRDRGSIVLEADGKHLLADVWTTVGILISLVIIMTTRWTIADPIAAILVSIGIGYTGFDLVKRSVSGLMDSPIDTADAETAKRILNSYEESHGIEFHAFRTRVSGSRKFIYFHLLVPDEWSVKKGHRLGHEIEDAIKNEIADAVLFVHIEPINDPQSHEDVELFSV